MTMKTPPEVYLLKLEDNTVRSYEWIDDNLIYNRTYSSMEQAVLDAVVKGQSPFRLAEFHIRVAEEDTK